MESVLYQRIKELCAEHNISISKLETELHFAPSSVKKWEKTSSPSVDRVIKVASYFNVSIDYLMGRTDIRSSMTEVLGNEDVISFQRAREKMTEQDREKMMQMLKIGFDYAFGEQEDNNN